MKCKYCGGDVTLNDHFCPSCGRPVDQAQRHQKEMREYETEFEETKQQAMNELAANSGGGTAVGIRLFIIAALVVLIFWMFINLDGYNMNQKREKKAANKNYKAYVEQIEQYLADRDYTQLSVFVDKHELDMNDKYDDFRWIFYGARDYKNIFEALLETAYIGKDTRDLYYAERLSDYVNQFYEDILSDSYTRLSEDPGKTEAVYNEMEADLAVLLQKYLSLTKEETDSMRGLTKSRRTVLIEQALDEKIVSVTGVGLSEMNKVELPEVEAAQEADQ